jgi:hypothetical protein
VKVAVLGFGKTSRDLAPYDDPSWDIWGCNGTWTIAKRLTCIFDLHAPWIYEWEMQRRPAGHVEHLRRFDGAVYLIEQRSDIPNSISYPLDDVIRYLGRPYLTSSIAMMVALAMMRGVTEIALYGVEMATASEYADQRPCLEWLLGLVEGRGITVTLPKDCPILSGPVYGRGDLNPGGERLTPDQFERRLQTLLKRQGELERQATRQDGRISEAEHILTGLGAAPEYRAHVEQMREQLVETIGNLARVSGMVSEARYWLAQTPEGAPQERWTPRLVRGVEAG